MTYQRNHAPEPLASDEAPQRPSEEAARLAVEAWLDKHAPGYPDYSICEDGDDGWAFWIAQQDTTSYLHHDLRIEWYGTGWPHNYTYNPDDGCWYATPDEPEPPGAATPKGGE